jgi:hypothetical protein
MDSSATKPRLRSNILQLSSKRLGSPFAPEDAVELHHDLAPGLLICLMQELACDDDEVFF